MTKRSTALRLTAAIVTTATLAMSKLTIQFTVRVIDISNVKTQFFF